MATLDTDFTESTFLKTDTFFAQKVRVLSNFAFMVFAHIWAPHGTFELRAPRGVLPKNQNLGFLFLGENDVFSFKNCYNNKFFDIFSFLPSGVFQVPLELK
jgi:hypothetical protein